MTSVIIAVYNGAGILPVTVPAVLEAQGVDEIVWVDDGSTDETRAVLEDLTDGEPRARVLALEVNTGRSSARNRGLAATSGDTAIFLDADVQPSSRSLLGLAEQLVGSAVAAVTRFVPVATDQDEPYQDYATRYARGPAADLEVGSVLEWRYFLTGACALRRVDLEAVGGFDESVAYGEDLVLATRLREEHPTGLRLGGPPVRLHDIGDLKRAIANARTYGASLGAMEGVPPDQTLTRMRPIAPLARVSSGVLHRVIQRLATGSPRRLLVRYLLAASALDAFARARDDASSAHLVGRDSV